MKYRATYQDGSRQYQVDIAAENVPHARAKFAQAHPGSTITRLEEINPSPRSKSAATPPRMPWEIPGLERPSDAEAERLAREARRLKEELRTKLGPAAVSKIRV